MFRPVSFFIGLRYSRSQNRSGFVSFITFFSIAGILLGVAALITVVSVMNGFEGELKKRILGLVPHVVISNGEQNFVDWQKHRQYLLQQPHVKQVTPLLTSEVLIQSETSLQGVLLQGILPEYEQESMLNRYMVAGKLASLSDSGYQLVIGQALANTLDVSIGSKVRLVLLNKTMFTPLGRIPVQRIFTVAGVFNLNSQVDDSVIYVHSSKGAKLLRRHGDGISQLRLYLDDAFSAQQVQKELMLDSKISPYQLSTWSESQGALFSAVKMEKNMMWLMLSLIIAVATFNVVSALVMVVIDKQGEIGILQTLGMTRIDILKVFISQGMINGLFGVILGAIFGILLTLNLNDLLMLSGINLFGNGYAAQILPIQLESINVVVIIVFALLMSFIATLYPAYRASKTQPAEVLRNE